MTSSFPLPSAGQAPLAFHTLFPLFSTSSLSKDVFQAVKSAFFLILQVPLLFSERPHLDHFASLDKICGPSESFSPS